LQSGDLTDISRHLVGRLISGVLRARRGRPKSRPGQSRPRRRRRRPQRRRADRAEMRDEFAPFQLDLGSAAEVTAGPGELPIPMAEKDARKRLFVDRRGGSQERSAALPVISANMRAQMRR
jgi:hypothetical protein